MVLDLAVISYIPQLSTGEKRFKMMSYATGHHQETGEITYSRC